LSKDKHSKPCKFWEDELERLDGENVLIVTSGGRFAGQLAFIDEDCLVRLAPSAPGLFPTTVAVTEIEAIVDLSSLNAADFEAFAAANADNFFGPSPTLFF
jgi:hypothetical protein